MKRVSGLKWLESVLEEEYQVVKILKQTEMKEVVHLRHKKLKRDILKKEFTGNDEAYRLLMRYEIPGVPRIYDAVSDGDRHLVLEEWIDGISVSEILEQKTYQEAGVRKIAGLLCDTLSALHSIRIIHRDIKPENVMITNRGEVKLVDFDAARIHKPCQGRDTVVMGTVGYAAPEQFGFGQSDRRTDIYAMGVLMNVMLTGEHPSANLYRGRLSKVIETCTQTDPRRRYSSAGELRKKL